VENQAFNNRLSSVIFVVCRDGHNLFDVNLFVLFLLCSMLLQTMS